MPGQRQRAKSARAGGATGSLAMQAEHLRSEAVRLDRELEEADSRLIQIEEQIALIRQQAGEIASLSGINDQRVSEAVEDEDGLIAPSPQQDDN
jgi:hypothetical protein